MQTLKCYHWCPTAPAQQIRVFVVNYLRKPSGLPQFTSLHGLTEPVAPLSPLFLSISLHNLFGELKAIYWKPGREKYN